MIFAEETGTPSSSNVGDGIVASNYRIDQTAHVVRENLRRIRMLAVAGTLLLHDESRQRVLGLIQKFSTWGISPPLVVIGVHNQAERDAAREFCQARSKATKFHVVRENKHTQLAGIAIKVFQERIDKGANILSAKRQTLLLARRGGKGKPKFITPFIEGQGTTCGEWTRPMVRNPDGSVTKGFMKASVAVGFCPVECPFCYLQVWMTDGMSININWEDLAIELQEKWSGYPYPINFGETSGLVEYDEWFADAHGTGSMIQYIIDACAAANVTPFFLTKIRFPGYLQFNGKVQVGISLMPESIRKWMAPHGSPTGELLESLSWAWTAGAVDPVIRLSVLWQEKHHYPKLLELIRQQMGPNGWRLTLDILRFSPQTATTIAKRHPQAAGIFAEEISPGSGEDLGELARKAKRTNEEIKKVRPPEERQAEIYKWFREQLDHLGCSDVMLTPCKADPQEMLPLVRSGIISSMPCACYGKTGEPRELVQISI